MAQCNPVPLCSHLMPSGKLCRGVALRGHRYCRSHIRNYRQLERDRAQFTTLEQFAAKIQPMDLCGILSELSLRLTHLSRTHNLNRFPEITYLLALSIDRIEESTNQTGPNALESSISPKLAPNQIPEDLSGFSFNEINQMIEGLTKSIA